MFALPIKNFSQTLITPESKCHAMAPIINSYNPDGVDEETLTGTGRGGILSGGYLRDDPLAAYLGDDERPVFVRSNSKKGVVRSAVEGESTERITPGEGYRAFAVATDVRLLFVIGDTDDGGDRSVSVPLSDVEVVEHSDGVLASEFVVTTAADVQWYFPSREGLDDIVEYLDAASLAWMRIERRLGNARANVTEATDCLESRTYDDAMVALDTAEEELAAAREAESELSEDGIRPVRTRIEQIREHVTERRVRTLESRAAHTIDRAESHWRNGEYDDAYHAFNDAHDDYVDALAAGDHNVESSVKLREKIARVERNISALERAPVERAENARSRAYDADDLAERADRLAYALDCYRTALEIDWGRSTKRFENDTDEIRDRIDAVARDLVETRRRLAAQHVKKGDQSRDLGQTDQAVSHYRTARDALEETVAPARELVPDTHDAVTDHLEAVEERLDRLDAADDQTPIPSGS